MKPLTTNQQPNKQPMRNQYRTNKQTLTNTYTQNDKINAQQVKQPNRNE